MRNKSDAFLDLNMIEEYEHGWNGRDARKLDPDRIMKAKQYVSRLANFRAPFINPLADGTIILWWIAQDRYFEIRIGEFIISMFEDNAHAKGDPTIITIANPKITDIEQILTKM